MDKTYSDLSDIVSIKVSPGNVAMYRPDNLHGLRYHSSFRRNVFPKTKSKTGFADPNRLLKTNYSWEWYEPSEHSAPVHYFLNTSLHGLRYLGQPKRHLCERIFWFIAVTAAVITSTLFIWKMWDGYKATPIITVFSPKEKLLNQIPFPAVTICSVNNVKQSKWDEYRAEAQRGIHGDRSVTNETLLRRLANMLDIYHICYSAKTFTQKFYTLFNRSADWDEIKQTMYDLREVYRPFLDPVGTLRNVSQSCEEMILFCLWLDSRRNCSELFKPIETDYGLCCTFNMIPLTLLKTYSKGHVYDTNLERDWKEADLTYENLILEDEHADRKYPYAQLYAGRSAGLSFLVDSNMAEYHCTNTDSEGFIVGLNTPLDFPRMRDNGIAIRAGTEVFISVNPEVTLSAESTRTAELEKRHCYFNGEKKLSFYKKYTASNCMDECIAKITLRKCNCLRYFMPRNNSYNSAWTVCRPRQYNCINDIKAEIIKNGTTEECGKCWPACTEIVYHSETTALRIRKSEIDKLFSYYPNITFDKSKTKNVAIVHIYFNMDSVFPRLRKEMTTIIDLISNAGGLLGLCMGFSMLSLLEIVYHATIRLLCKKYRERHEINEVTVIGVNTLDPNHTNQTFFMPNKASHSMFRNINNNQRDFSGENFSSSNMDNKSIFKQRLQGSKLPAFNCPPFNEDFQRAYFATTPSPWMQLEDVNNTPISRHNY